MTFDEQQFWVQVFHTANASKNSALLAAREAGIAVQMLRCAQGQPDYQAAIKRAIRVLGPEAPACSGCQAEWTAALEILKDAVGE